MEKRAVIVGGTKGIGYAIAIELAKKSWIVSVIGSNMERLEKSISDAEKEGITLKGFCCDVRNESEVEETFKSITSDGEIELFVNCVGKNFSNLLVKLKQDEIFTMSYEKWKECIDINLNTTFLCSREEAKYMIEKNIKGTIINISTSLRAGGYGQSAYLATKSAIASLTSSWAIELAKYGIRVGCIAPGAIEGQALIDASKRSEGHALYMNKLKEQIPLKRFALENEVADTVIYIANNEYFTGSVIDLDGGSLPKRVML